jgi:hypothetical protein
MKKTTRTKRPGRILRIVAITLAPLAIASGTALPASAAPATNPTAYNTRTQYLTATPNPQVNPPACVYRSITLEPGTYTYSLILPAGRVDPSQTFTVYPTVPSRGTYYWEDCLEPQTGGYYDQNSTLVAPDNEIAASLDVSVTVNPSGVWQWGSELIPPN